MRSISTSGLVALDFGVLDRICVCFCFFLAWIRIGIGFHIYYYIPYST